MSADNGRVYGIKGSALLETKPLKDNPELREKAIKKIAEDGLEGSHIKMRSLVGQLKRVETEEEQEAILSAPTTNYTEKADRIIKACQTILSELKKDEHLMLKIPAIQAGILSGYLNNVRELLKTWDAEEADVVDNH